VLYESKYINEYIDERFPHPQLMPRTGDAPKGAPHAL